MAPNKNSQCKDCASKSWCPRYKALTEATMITYCPEYIREEK